MTKEIKCKKKQLQFEQLRLRVNGIFTRGGVEDTRLEAKAKNTKNSEAKAKDRLSRGQEPRTQAQVFSKQKKRVFKNFFRRSQKKVFKQLFQAKKLFKKFLSGDLHLRKTKKIFANFP